ncbi:AT-rich interactive domain-containing protein 4-like [Pyrus communis]|uniref:AT-rich interactive domain-containing protein 4-like n=1 Tax=Pyrus communis TaxID=23211 RepID=UPI0035C1F5F6
MFHSQGASKHPCSLLVVNCAEISEEKCNKDTADDRLRYPFPELVSSGRLEVQTLTKPTKEELCKMLEAYKPNLVYLQGEQLGNNEIGSLVWEDVDLSTPEAISEIFGATLPTTVYLEVPYGATLAAAIHSKGIPYVIYWRSEFSSFAACHFRHALLSVVQSSSTHTWDAFQLAYASFRLYCVENNHLVPANIYKSSAELGPCLLGDRIKINVDLPEVDMEENEEGSLGTLPAIKIHDDDVTLRFLVCGEPSTLDASLLEPLEDGLNALLNIEMRGSKLHGKFSAPPPPLQAGTFSRGVVTMRCDVSTCSSAHISLLVSGSAQTCFDDQLLENHIKHEIIEESQLVRALPKDDETKAPLSEPRKSASIACGATVFEVNMKVPAWASQVLRQLAPDVSYHSLVALGIASIQGLPVASFEKDDADRLLFFSSSPGKDGKSNDLILSSLPTWLRPPPPSRKRSQPCQETSLGSLDSQGLPRLPASKIDEDNRVAGAMNGVSTSLLPARQRLKIAAMRPIPHVRRPKMTPFCGMSEVDGHEGGQVKAHMPPPPPPTKLSIVGLTPTTQRKSYSSSSQAKQIISLNPLPLKKHGCGRSPIHSCLEEEFLKDVMQFLILRGHNRLIPQGGLAEFPDAILNGKRLDLYNLYKEVVTRGGFHVGNGINWKGQIFSKMRNYTMTNRMTGVGNTLKRHYETYLLEYELAHDDVDGECCLLCHSSAAGDWVNCGICGEWAHFGCDRRQGLGAFKDYAKTDGLEYICPHCSISNFKKKPQKIANGFSQGSTVSRPL